MAQCLGGAGFPGDWELDGPRLLGQGDGGGPGVGWSRGLPVPVVLTELASSRVVVPALSTGTSLRGRSEAVRPAACGRWGCR